jgi:hypothetical protein
MWSVCLVAQSALADPHLLPRAHIPNLHRLAVWMPLLLPLTVPVFGKSRLPKAWLALAHAFSMTTEHSIAVPSRCIPPATFALQKSHSTPSGDIGRSAGCGGDWGNSTGQTR